IINGNKTSQEAFSGGMDVEQTDDGITQKTLNEGDIGHLDLLADFGDAQPVGVEAEDEGPKLDLGNSSPTYYQHFPESQRFVSRTPASQKNGNSPENLATPSLPHNPLAREGTKGGSVISLSQVF